VDSTIRRVECGEWETTTADPVLARCMERSGLGSNTADSWTRSAAIRDWGKIAETGTVGRWARAAFE
jgi:hypothetical protein